ncbi:MAG: DUF1549 domain-containing protein [Planctomycetes bacterium]|nr:DUF1549 domain-containing protein [Planctomycetota bacterium]
MIPTDTVVRIDGMKIRSRIFRCSLFLSSVAVLALHLRVESTAVGQGDLPRLFQAVRPVPVPEVQMADWASSSIDRFILAKLEARGIHPALAADLRTLLRRVTFDLTGLPPTVSEIDDFLTDDSPDAFAKVVDRLLASPQYGERWGRHWLDVVRYADARDLIQLPVESDFREAWRYRDWVVAAFNRDLPYDQFVSQQVAGDLMQPNDSGRIDADALVATGMLAIADFVPGDVDKQQMIADYVNDQIDVVGRAFLGLTLSCARCHDHKFDPITIEDYYSLAGIFFSTRLVPGPVKGNTPLVRVPLLSAAELAAIDDEQKRDQARLAELTSEINQFGDREYRGYLQRSVETQSRHYLVSAWEFVHASGSERPAIGDWAKARGLDATTLTRWVAYLQEANPHHALTSLRQASDQEAAAQRSAELESALAAFAVERNRELSRDPARKALAESAVVILRADDRRITTTDGQRVTNWPNRGRALDASPAADVAAPTVTTIPICGHDQFVLHFSGNELLQLPLTVPESGSVFVVFKPDSDGPAGQRVLGWEDSSVGQHGLGIMIDGSGQGQAILRRNGASGDVSLPAPRLTDANPCFQILSITWGPDGVSVFRQGEVVGQNKGIDCVSSDPAIPALRIGAPGSGQSARFRGCLAELRVYQQPLDDQARTRVEAELAQRWCAMAPPTQVDPIADLYEELVSAQSPFRLELTERHQVLPPDFQARLTELRSELAALQKKPKREIPRAVVVQEGGPAGTPHEGFHDAHVYLRGNHEKPGPVVPRGVPKALAGAEQLLIREGSGRRELARWLTRADNPLTGRVIVNRIWQHHFGIGLISTSTNFGLMGEAASHPELLDHLAARFMSAGWSIKTLHRQILLSNVYQQSAMAAVEAPAGSADPENRLLGRANRRRLEAEAIRDSLLAISGRLDSTMGGPGFQDAATPRRSLYLMSVRTGAKSAEFGPLFDAADCAGIVDRRNESIVAPQALFFMNDPLVTDLAAAIAVRIADEAPEPRNRIERLYQIALGRFPAPAEIEVGTAFLADQSDLDGWTRYCRLIVCTNEFLFVD